VRRLGAALSWPLRRIGAAGPLLGRGIQSVGKGVGGLGRRGRALAQGVAARRNQQSGGGGGDSSGKGNGNKSSSSSRRSISRETNGLDENNGSLDGKGSSSSINQSSEAGEGGDSAGSSCSSNNVSPLEEESVQTTATATAEETSAPAAEIPEEPTSQAAIKGEDKSGA